MPYVENINVPPEVLELWEKSCVIRPGYWGVKVDKKEIVWRKRNFTSLIARGEFQGLANIWNNLTVEEQGAWDDAGYWAGMSGWDLFAMDTLYRISNGIQGVATPDLYHQYKVGEIKIAGSAEQIEIKQFYPSIPDTEVGWAFNVMTDLASTGAGSYAKFIVRIKTGYWLDDINDWEILIYEYDLTEFDLFWEYVQDSYIDGFWGSGQITFSIKVYKMTGTVYIDGIELNYNDLNNAIDFQCNDIELYWQAVIQPSGATFLSIYPPDW